jgi:hypothetical protein
MLPDEVLWRTTEAMSDGFSIKDRAWYTIINEYATQLFEREFAAKLSQIRGSSNRYSEMVKYDDVMKHTNGHNIPTNAEQYWYRREFERNFAGIGSILPYQWMPRYAPNIYDPSPRSLDIYKDEADEEENITCTKNETATTANATATTTVATAATTNDTQLQEYPQSHVINTESGQIIESTENNENGLPRFRIEEVIRDGENGSKEHDINIHINL